MLPPVQRAAGLPSASCAKLSAVEVGERLRDLDTAMHRLGIARQESDASWIFVHGSTETWSERWSRIEAEDEAEEASGDADGDAEWEWEGEEEGVASDEEWVKNRWIQNALDTL